MALLDEFADSRPEDVVWRGSEWFVDANAVQDVVEEATLRGVKVLGLEGFLIGEAEIFPALGRIADFSHDPVAVANRKALDLLRGEWAAPPTAADQMHSDATGRYMVAVVLDG